MFAVIFYTFALLGSQVLSYEDYFFPATSDPLKIDTYGSSIFRVLRRAGEVQEVVDTTVVITVNETSAVTIQYLAPYFFGYIVYSNNGTTETSNRLERYLPDLKYFVVTPQQNLTIHWESANVYKEWINIDFIAHISPPTADPKTCPFAGDNEIIIDKPLLLIPDYTNDESLGAKDCTWRFKAPPAGKVLQFTWLSIGPFPGYGSLELRGYFEGVEEIANTTEVWEHYEYYVSATYDSNATARFERLPSDEPFFEIFVILVQLIDWPYQTSCSLDFNSQLFTEPSGIITNIKPLSTYDKAQECRWRLSFPINTCLELRTDYSLSYGDELKIEFGGTIYSHKKYSIGDLEYIQNYWNDDEVFFTFETDSTFEAKGFRINYRLLDPNCQTEVAAAPVKLTARSNVSQQPRMLRHIVKEKIRKGSRAMRLLAALGLDDAVRHVAR